MSSVCARLGSTARQEQHSEDRSDEGNKRDGHLAVEPFADRIEGDEHTEAALERLALGHDRELDDGRRDDHEKDFQRVTPAEDQRQALEEEQSDRQAIGARGPLGATDDRDQRQRRQTERHCDIDRPKRIGSRVPWRGDPG
jgi:hypothetical protein